MLLNPRQSPAQSVDVEIDADVAPNVDEPRMEAVLEDEDDWDFEGAVGLEEVEHVDIKQRSRDLQEARRFSGRKVPGIIADAVELADELFKQVGESETEMATAAALVAQPAVETEVLSLPANLVKSREDAASASVKLDALPATVESVAKKRNATLAKVR